MIRIIIVIHIIYKIKKHKIWLYLLSPFISLITRFSLRCLTFIRNIHYTYHIIYYYHISAMLNTNITKTAATDIQTIPLAIIIKWMHISSWLLSNMLQREWQSKYIHVGQGIIINKTIIWMRATCHIKWELYFRGMVIPGC